MLFLDLHSRCCVQVSISGQALVFVVRTASYSLFSRAGFYTYIAFFGAQASIFALLISAVPPFAWVLPKLQVQQEQKAASNCTMSTEAPRLLGSNLACNESNNLLIQKSL